jgi:hypothetical protein
MGHDACHVNVHMSEILMFVIVNGDKDVLPGIK